MADFWRSCGYQQLARGDGGRLVVTDDYLRNAYAAIHAGIAASGAGYVEVTRLTPERMAQ